MNRTTDDILSFVVNAVFRFFFYRRAETRTEPYYRSGTYQNTMWNQLVIAL